MVVERESLEPYFESIRAIKEALDRYDISALPGNIISRARDNFRLSNMDEDNLGRVSAMDCLRYITRTFSHVRGLDQRDFENVTVILENLIIINNKILQDTDGQMTCLNWPEDLIRLR